MSLNDFYIVLTACLVTIACVIPGCFLVLRKMTMFGDAISHAVLPGIVAAYMLSGNIGGWPMIAGATSIGLALTWIIEFIHKRMHVSADASIGISYTFFFALGLILVSAFTRQTDLDQDCVLYGEIALVPFDLGWLDIPRQIWIASILNVVLITVLLIGYRGFWISTFDASYATVAGLSAVFWHYLLMAMVSLSTVTAFESVGAIMVVSLLTGPAATAALFSKSLPRMILLAALFGIAACILAYAIASRLDASIAGCIAVTNALLFATAAVLKRVIGSTY
jgi:manganese/zinc/iron transport system permease protein